MKNLLFVCAIVLPTISYGAVSQKQLQSYFEKNMEGSNVKTLKRDKIFHAYKLMADKFHFVIDAHPGPEKFKQIVIQCDQCTGSAFTDNQLASCNEHIKSFYSVFGKQTDRDFLGDLKRADKRKHIKLSPDSAFKIRLSSGDLKCDSQGPGTRIRIDFFTK
jgi:hypothetical protein